MTTPKAFIHSIKIQHISEWGNCSFFHFFFCHCCFFLAQARVTFFRTLTLYKQKKKRQKVWKRSTFVSAFLFPRKRNVFLFLDYKKMSAHWEKKRASPVIEQKKASMGVVTVGFFFNTEGTIKMFLEVAWFDFKVQDKARFKQGLLSKMRVFFFLMKHRKFLLDCADRSRRIFVRPGYMGNGFVDGVKKTCTRSSAKGQTFLVFWGGEGVFFFFLQIKKP